jgi:hypothetical protein
MGQNRLVNLYPSGKPVACFMKKGYDQMRIKFTNNIPTLNR